MIRRCRSWIAAVLLGVFAGGIVNAGEETSCFSRGQLGSCAHQVLPHVEFKAVVLQFVDPMQTGLGEGLARLLWREILESISDLSGAGVILAYDREGEIEKALGESDLNLFLQREYHDAALRIAEQQNAQMSIWGAVLQDGDEIFVQTFLTLRQTADDPWMTLTLTIPQPRQTKLEAPLGAGRINLPPIRSTRQALFDRWFLTRCSLRAGCPQGVDLRAGPSNDAPVVERVPVESRVQAMDMQQQWLEVRSSSSGESDGEEAPARWINVYHVEMLPQDVEFLTRRNVNLRAGPMGRKLASVDLDGRYQVLNAARWGHYREPWYEIQADGRRGWVAGRLVNRRSYMFPAVHLIAGLYRYGRGQYERAGEEFETFLRMTPPEDNVTRATVLKFLAASRLPDGSARGSGDLPAAVADLDAAARLTPFDPSVYTVLSLVRVSSGTQLAGAVRDLSRALDLDRRDGSARRLLRDMSALSSHGGLERLGRGEDTRQLAAELSAMQKKYLTAED